MRAAQMMKQLNPDFPADAEGGLDAATRTSTAPDSEADSMLQVAQVQHQMMQEEEDQKQQEEEQGDDDYWDQLRQRMQHVMQDNAMETEPEQEDAQTQLQKPMQQQHDPASSTAPVPAAAAKDSEMAASTEPQLHHQVEQQQQDAAENSEAATSARVIRHRHIRPDSGPYIRQKMASPYSVLSSNRVPAKNVPTQVYTAEVLHAAHSEVQILAHVVHELSTAVLFQSAISTGMQCALNMRLDDQDPRQQYRAVDAMCQRSLALADQVWVRSQNRIAQLEMLRLPPTPRGLPPLGPTPMTPAMPTPPAASSGSPNAATTPLSALDTDERVSTDAYE